MQHFSHHLAMRSGFESDRSSQKKRRQQCRHRNTVSKALKHFSKKKPPYPIKSGSAAQTDKIGSVFDCAFSWL